MEGDNQPDSQPYNVFKERGFRVVLNDILVPCVECRRQSTFVRKGVPYCRDCARDLAQLEIQQVADAKSPITPPFDINEWARRYDDLNGRPESAEDC